MSELQNKKKTGEWHYLVCHALESFFVMTKTSVTRAI